jgi:uncharacterized protein YeaO (DUF488 family)
MASSALRKKHDEAMKTLVKDASHWDVLLVSAEKEELHAHKCILAAHSKVTNK